MSQKEIYQVNYANSSQLSPVEAKILTQYQLLATQLSTLSSEIEELNTSNSERKHEGSGETENAESLLDNFRNLEIKMGLVYTLFKGAVYSIFLQNEENLNLESEGRDNDEENEEIDNAHILDDAQNEVYEENQNKYIGVGDEDEEEEAGS